MADEGSIDIPFNTADAQKNINDLLLNLQSFGEKADKTLKAFAESQKKHLGEAKHEVENIGEKFEGLKRIVEGLVVFKVAEFAVETFVDVLKEGIGASVEHEQALTRLNTALQSTGEGGREASKDMQEFADQLSQTSRFSETAALSALALAKSFGITNEQAKELVKAATELSARTGKDLQTTTTELAGTFSGVTREIGRLIPGVKQLTKEQLAHGDAIKLVGEAYGGSALAEIQTYGGAVIQTQHAIEKFQETLGSVITQNPEVVAVVKSITAIFSGLGKAIEENKGGIGQVVSSFASGILGELPDIVRGFGAIAEVFGVLTAVNPFPAVNEELTNTASFAANVADDILLLAEGFAAVTGSVKLLGTLLEGIAQHNVNILDKLEESAAATGQKIEDIEAIRQRLAQAEVGTAAGADSSAEKIAKTIESLRDNIKKFADDADKAGKKTARSFDDVDPELKKLRAELEKLDDSLYKGTLDASDQARLEFSKTIALIEKGRRELKGYGDVANDEETRAYQVFQNKIAAINEETNKKIASQNAAIAANPGELINADVVDAKAITAAVAGAIADGVQGAEGAKKLIGGIAGTIANLYIPGIGPVISQLFQTLSQDPAITTSMVKSFTEAFPEIFTNLAAALPAVVEGIIQGLTTLATAKKFVELIVAAFGGGAYTEVGKAFGRAIGVHTGDEFKGPQFRRTVSDIFNKAGTYFIEGVTNGMNAFQNRLFASGQRFHNDVGDAARNFEADIKHISKEFEHQLSEAGKSLGIQALGSLDTKSLSSKGAIFSGGIFQKLEASGAEFVRHGKNIGAGLFQKINEAEDFFKKLGGEIAKGFKDGIASAATLGASGGGKAGGFFNDIGKGKVDIPHLAGGGQVKSGYANDSLLSFIGSGEDVVDAGTNKKLNEFLDKGGNGAMSATLERIEKLLSQPMSVTSTATVSGKAFADINLNLSRRNARTKVS